MLYPSPVPKYGNAVGLYRDDGLGIFKEAPRKIECIKKNICKIFRQNNLRFTVEANKKVVNFLDTTLDLNTGQYILYSKPNNTLRYVNVASNQLTGCNQKHTRGYKQMLIRDLFERGNIRTCRARVPKIIKRRWPSI